MGTEIERKFLVKDDSWRRDAGPGILLRQGYLAAGEGLSVRVRTDGQRAWLTVKGPSEGLSRAEFEYAVPTEDAAALLGLCGARLVEKRRHRLEHSGHLWEIDEFLGANAGLIMAEVELRQADQAVAQPDWVGPEVSGDKRFENASLSQSPYGVWGPRL
ncbi:MAG: CYTH domain-containing protein [Chthoniobacterales bacterium]